MDIHAVNSGESKGSDGGTAAPMRVLAIGAHPDDVELLAAGTLAHYVTQGASAVIAVVTNGELGSRDLSPAEAARARQSEAERAANILGAELFWMGQSDGFLLDSRETRLMFVDLFRRYRPDVVFAHHPGDYHPDHRIAGQLANIARLLAPSQGIETAHPPNILVPPLFYMDTFTAAGAPRPDLWVDVTSTMQYKEAMLVQHVSQNNSGDSDLLAPMRRQAALRGRQINVPYAEAFFCASTYPATAITDVVPAGNKVTIPVARASDQID